MPGDPHWQEKLVPPPESPHDSSSWLLPWAHLPGVQGIRCDSRNGAITTRYTCPRLCNLQRTLSHHHGLGAKRRQCPYRPRTPALGHTDLDWSLFHSLHAVWLLANLSTSLSFSVLIWDMEKILMHEVFMKVHWDSAYTRYMVILCIYI